VIYEVDECEIDKMFGASGRTELFKTVSDESPYVYAAERVVWGDPASML
jgi:hypothetical protein